MKQLFKKILIAFLGGLILFVVAIWTLDWYFGTFYYNFTMEDKLKIELTADECGTCLLDQAVEYDIEITDLTNKKAYNFNFFMGRGPSMRFCFSPDQPNLIFIEGYDRNDGLSFLINLNDSTIHQAQVYDSISSKHFVPTHILEENFELTKE